MLKVHRTHVFAVRTQHVVYNQPLNHQYGTNLAGFIAWMINKLECFGLKSILY